MKKVQNIKENDEAYMILHPKYKINKDVKISKSCNQLVIRIPAKVVEFMKIKKGDFINFHAVLVECEKNKKKSILKITYRRFYGRKKKTKI